MNNKLLKTIILTIIVLVSLYVPRCYAAGASVGASTTSAKPGDTVELYIDLSTASIGYDLQISTSDDDLISSSEVVSKIGSGDTSRIYLVQLAGSDDRTTYPVGTRIATIKYTIAETATVGSTLTLNVAGEVAGETSSDKNSMNESVTINIVDSSNEGQEPEQEQPGQEQPGQEQPEQENPPQENLPQDEQSQDVTSQGDQNQEVAKVSENGEKDDSIAPGVIPKAGVKGFAILVLAILVAIMCTSFRKYNKNKDIK